MGMPGQGHGNDNYRKMMDWRMMDQRNTIDCTGCMMNRLLKGSMNFFIDMQKSLDLTDTQVDELQEIRLNYEKEICDLQGDSVSPG